MRINRTTVSRLVRRTTALALVAFLSGCVQNPLQPEREDPTEVALIRLAGSDNAVAQHRLCYMYSYGKGVEPDYEKALLWCELAAQKGDPSSMTLYAEKFYHGQGTAQDYAEAFLWYEKAAEQGHSYAQFMLATLYLRGLGTETDPEKARYWLGRSAKGDYEPAAELLQKLDNQSEGETPDPGSSEKAPATPEPQATSS